jgi:hypothetical protein
VENRYSGAVETKSDGLPNTDKIECLEEKSKKRKCEIMMHFLV